MQRIDRIFKLIRDGVSFSWAFDHPRPPEKTTLRAEARREEESKIAYVTQQWAAQALFNDNRITYEVVGDMVKIYW